jgi:hypothetical protein
MHMHAGDRRGRAPGRRPWAKGNRGRLYMGMGTTRRGGEAKRGIRALDLDGRALVGGRMHAHEHIVVINEKAK